MTLIPAYGRDYTTAAQVKADWAAGKDFIIANHFNRYDGKPVNLQGCRDAGEIYVMIRYRKLRASIIIKINSGT